MLSDFEFTPESLQRAIDELKLHSAAGPDGVPAILLKKCAYVLSNPLFLLWRASLNSGRIPEKLKLGYITPIYKGGDKTEPKNYRPIALTSHISKVFEKVVRKEIVELLDRDELFNPGQHGFRQGRS